MELARGNRRSNRQTKKLSIRQRTSRLATLRTLIALHPLRVCTRCSSSGFDHRNLTAFENEERTWRLMRVCLRTNSFPRSNKKEKREKNEVFSKKIRQK